jgi:NhaP-type Na+/H+ and K+/H+ antiporter
MGARLKGRPVVGDRVAMGEFELVVQRVHQGKVITAVGLSFAKDAPTEAMRRAALRRSAALEKLFRPR